jgi:CheY-like chemotaxis protein
MLIAMTGYGGELIHTRAGRAGFDHFLVKPVNIASLQEHLATRR